MKRNLCLYIINIITGIIILAGVILRLTLYGDISLSIGTNDSKTYITASEIMFPSKDFFAGRVVPSYPLFLKILSPTDGYQPMTAVSYPAASSVGTNMRGYQPGYGKVVMAQTLISIFGWVFFTIVVLKNLKQKILRPFAALIILLFAFSPSLAEWDFVIMTESISLSFFIILAALSLELIFRILKEKQNISISSKVVIILWMLTILIWSSIRDSNATSLIISILILFTFLIVPKLRRQMPVPWLISMVILLIGSIALYSYGTSNANRFVWSWNNIWNHWMAGSQSRINFFTSQGMPDPWTKEWASTYGAQTYFKFLISHPGFIVSELLIRLSDVFSENMQPYYFTYLSIYRKMVLAINDIFHPLSSFVFAFPLVGLLLVGMKTFLSKLIKGKNLPWFIFLLWFCGSVYIIFLASFFGDGAGVIRHTIGAVAFLRLLVWLIPIILFEVSSEPA